MLKALDNAAPNVSATSFLDTSSSFVIEGGEALFMRDAGEAEVLMQDDVSVPVLGLNI